MNNNSFIPLAMITPRSPVSQKVMASGRCSPKDIISAIIHDPALLYDNASVSSVEIGLGQLGIATGGDYFTHFVGETIAIIRQVCRMKVPVSVDDNYVELASAPEIYYLGREFNDAHKLAITDANTRCPFGFISPSELLTRIYENKVEATILPEEKDPDDYLTILNEVIADVNAGITDGISRAIYNNIDTFIDLCKTLEFALGNYIHMRLGDGIVNYIVFRKDGYNGLAVMIFRST